MGFSTRYPWKGREKKLKKTARDNELSQNVKVLDRPAFPEHFNIIYTCNDHDTSGAVTKLNITKTIRHFDNFLTTWRGPVKLVEMSVLKTF